MTQDASHSIGIYTVNVARLSRAWIYTTGDAIESTPVVADGVVYVVSNDYSLFAFNQASIMPEVQGKDELLWMTRYYRR